MNNIFHPGEKESMLTRLQYLQPDAEALWGKMNVQQMLVHLADPIRGILRERPARVVVSPFLRPFIKWYVLRKRSFRKNLVTFRPYLQAKNGKGSALTTFESDKAELVRLIQSFCSTADNFEFGAHAGAGVLTRTQYGALLWKHLDHHFRQFGV